MKYFLYISLFLSFITCNVSAQTYSNCENYLSNGYISDGQYNITNIKKGETKSTKITLLSGNTYRIVVCSEKTSKLRFEIVDQNENILFSNKDYNYTQYWDFEIQETIECKIKLFIDDPSILIDNTILLIGYKN